MILKGSKERSTRATGVNADSSRSHAIIQIQIKDSAKRLDDCSYVVEPEVRQVDFPQFQLVVLPNHLLLCHPLLLLPLILPSIRVLSNELALNYSS